MLLYSQLEITYKNQQVCTRDILKQEFGSFSMFQCSIGFIGLWQGFFQRRSVVCAGQFKLDGLWSKSTYQNILFDATFDLRIAFACQAFFKTRNQEIPLTSPAKSQQLIRRASLSSVHVQS